MFSVGVRSATVAMQRRGKRTSSTIEVVFSAWSMPRSYLEDNWRYSAVEGSVVECLPASNRSWRVSIAKIHYQETSSEDTAEE
jgi:hypothetical protein